jgi:hypothetical protein
LTCVCRFPEFLTHAPCLAQIEDDFECDRKFQKSEELEEKMEEQDMKPTNQLSREKDSERLASCW